MRICFVLGSFPSVSETFVLGQITGMIDRGHEVLIFAGARPAEAVIHPDVARYGLLSRVRYYQDKPRNWLARLWRVLCLLPGAWRREPAVVRKAFDVRRYGKEAASLNLFLRAQAFLEVRDFDVVVAHFGSNGLVASAMKELGAVRGELAVFFHAADLSAYPRRHGADVYRPLFAQARICLPVSGHARTRLLELGCPEEKICVHRMGVRLPPLRIRERGKVLRLLSVARFVEKKGLWYGIEGMARLWFTDIPVEYTLVGDGPMFNAVKDHAYTYGMARGVSFPGWQDAEAVARHMDAAHILVVPSIQAEDGDEEGIPVVIMEAMAAGVCVMTTPTGAIPELVVNKVTGYLVPPKDGAALGYELKEVWNRWDEACAVALRARKAVEEQHDIQVLNGRLEEILKGLVHA